MLSALVAVAVVHVNLAGNTQALLAGRSSSIWVGEASTPSPHEEDGKGPGVSLPFCATVPAAEPRQPSNRAPGGTTLSKGDLADLYLADLYLIAAAGARAALAVSPAGSSTLLSHSPAFPVYRL